MTIISVKEFAEDLILVEWCEGTEFMEQLWSAGKSRKHGTCAGSGQRYKPGDLVYRPITNRSNRARRMLATWVASNAIKKPAVKKRAPR